MKIHSKGKDYITHGESQWERFKGYTLLRSWYCIDEDDMTKLFANSMTEYMQQTKLSLIIQTFTSFIVKKDELNVET